MTETTGTTTAERAHPISRFAERLHTVLDGLGEVPGWSMTADDQRAALVELARAEARLTALRLRVLAAADSNAVGLVNASPTTGAWLAQATRQNRTDAHADVRLAKALDGGLTATRDALTAGRVTEAQARVIAHAVTRAPKAVSSHDKARAEAHLLGLAAEHDAAALTRLARYVFEVLDPDSADEKLGKKLADEEREARRRTFLKLRDNGDGTTSGTFKIPTLHGQMLRTALEALTAPRRVGPEARRHADGTPFNRPELLGMGLCEYVERYPLHRLPQTGGANATVVVTMTLEQLLRGLGAARVIGGPPISAGEARRLACTAGLVPAVLGGRSEVLDLGKRRRTHSRAQRLAMTLRDETCATEHCDRPATWCEAHHDTRRWADGGTTTAKDGRFLCPWHHHRTEDPSYDMTRLANGKIRFTRRQ